MEHFTFRRFPCSSRRVPFRMVGWLDKSFSIDTTIDCPPPFCLLISINKTLGLSWCIFKNTVYYFNVLNQYSFGDILNGSMHLKCPASPVFHMGYTFVATIVPAGLAV